MARRCLEKFVINGSDYSLMQIDLNNISLSSYSERTNLYLQSGTSTPSYVTDTGYNFDNLIPDITVTVDIPIENSKNASVHNRPYNTNYGYIGINYNVTNEYIGSGGRNHVKDCFSVIIDDGYAWILQYGVESGYSFIEAIGGNNSIGQHIYNNYYVPISISNGGGATHIAKVTGQLSTLSSHLSDILIVSGGGGGGLLADDEYRGKNAGGISGSGDNSADQTTGNAFGLGESGSDVSGGGSGLYGGYKGTSSKSGGAGSGYIGNSLVSNKKMVGYNVPTSSAESTKTESVNEASETPVANKPKIGNGFARIKLLRATSDISFFTSSLSSDLMVEDWDITNVKDSLTYGNPTMQPTMYSEFFLTEWNFNIGNQWAPSTTISNGELVRTGRGDNRSDAVFWIPVNRINKTIIKITADYKVTDQRHWGSGFDRIGFWVGYVDSNNEWHSVSLGNKYPDDENWHTGGEWVYNGTLIPYIDYIGIEGGDGIYHAKNIVLTVG